MVFGTFSNAPMLVVVLSILAVGLALCFGCKPLGSGTSINRTTEISRVLERAVEHGAKIEDPMFRADLFLDLAPSYVGIGDTNKAIEARQ